mgnify:CR=1 FL=1
MVPLETPTAVVWPWREREARDETRRVAAVRAARGRGLIQAAVGLAAAAAMNSPVPATTAVSR